MKHLLPETFMAVDPHQNDQELTLQVCINKLQEEIERLKPFETKAQFLEQQNDKLLLEIRKLEREIGGLISKLEG